MTLATQLRLGTIGTDGLSTGYGGRCEGIGRSSAIHAGAGTDMTTSVATSRFERERPRLTGWRGSLRHSAVETIVL